MAPRKKKEAPVDPPATEPVPEHIKAWADAHVGKPCEVRVGGDDDSPQIHRGTINSYEVVGDQVLFEVDGRVVDLGRPPLSPEEQAKVDEALNGPGVEEEEQTEET